MMNEKNMNNAEINDEMLENVTGGRKMAGDLAYRGKESKIAKDTVYKGQSNKVSDLVQRDDKNGKLISGDVTNKGSWC
jgi:hypothetical protein